MPVEVDDKLLDDVRHGHRRSVGGRERGHDDEERKREAAAAAILLLLLLLLFLLRRSLVFACPKREEPRSACEENGARSRKRRKKKKKRLWKRECSPFFPSTRTPLLQPSSSSLPGQLPRFVPPRAAQREREKERERGSITIYSILHHNSLLSLPPLLPKRALFASSTLRAAPSTKET